MWDGYSWISARPLMPFLMDCQAESMWNIRISMQIHKQLSNDTTLSKSDKDVNVLEYKTCIASQTATKWFKDNFMKANAPKFQVAFTQEIKKLKV